MNFASSYIYIVELYISNIFTNTSNTYVVYL